MSFRALQIGAGAMTSQEIRLEVTANNLANVSTDGFKRSAVQFQDIFYQQEGNPGPAGIGQEIVFGHGAVVAGTAVDFRQGPLRETQQDLDLAVSGMGFFVVRAPDGISAYTRAGHFTLNAQGELMTPAGFLVQPTIRIPSDVEQVQIDPDGVVSAVSNATPTPQFLGQLEAARFPNPQGLIQAGHNLFIESVASGGVELGTFADDGFGMVRQGFLESSNVEAVEELTGLIENQQAFQLNAQVVQSANQRLERLLRLTGG